MQIISRATILQRVHIQNPDKSVVRIEKMYEKNKIIKINKYIRKKIIIKKIF